MKQRYKMLLLVAACVLQVAFVTPVTAQDADDALSDEYVGGDFGRLLYQENGVTVRRTSTETSPSLERVAGLNAPVFPGDGVITAFDQRAEIQLAGGSLVRIDRATDLTFLALSDPYAELADNTVLQLEQGVIRISALLADDSEFRIDTPVASILLLDDAELRIEVDESGRTEVASYHGVVEVHAGDEATLLRSGTRTEIYPGQAAPEQARAFNTLRGDGFDRWVDERDAEQRDYDRVADNDEAYDEVPEEVRPYYRELSGNGKWVYTTEFGWTWSPSGVSADWRPYSDGYWAYGSRGYFWVSHERWGWAPYHYGRWSYVNSYGWCWIPGRVFGGAWVAWSWGSAHVGWSPLGFWNTAYCGSPWAYSYGYYGPSWTFVNYNHFHYRNYRRYAVPYNQLGRDYLTSQAVVTRPPRVSPNALARSADTRARAYQQARGDRSARLRPVANDVRNANTSLRGSERRLVDGRGERSARIRERDGAITGGGRGGTAVGRGQNGRVIDRAASRGSSARTRTGPGTTSLAPRNGNGVTRGTANGRSGGVVRSGTRDSAKAKDDATPRQRMRRVYESMATPRSTQPRSGTAPRATGSSAGSTSRRPRETAQPGTRPGSRTRTTPARPRSGNGGQSTSASPSRTPRSRGGSSSATPSQRSGSRQPSRAVTPRRAPSGGGGSKATRPSRPSGGGGSKSARPSKPSGGGGSKATPSRGGGKKGNR